MSAQATAPADLAAARRIAAKVFPAGLYRQVLGTNFERMVKPMLDQMPQLIAGLAAASGREGQGAPALTPAQADEVMRIMDPAYRQRTERQLSVMSRVLAERMATYEPSMREGLAEAYARRFSAAQLAEIERFCATPTGAQFVGQTMLIYTDPQFASRMQGTMRDLMSAMPDLMKEVQSAGAGLPPPRPYTELSPSERARIDAILKAATPAPSKR